MGRYGVGVGQARELGQARGWLEWLLVLYEGSADENILQLVVDKMDFAESGKDTIVKNMNKVD